MSNRNREAGGIAKPRGVSLEVVEGWRNHRGKRIPRGVKVRVGTNYSVIPVAEFLRLIENMESTE